MQRELQHADEGRLLGSLDAGGFVHAAAQAACASCFAVALTNAGPHGEEIVTHSRSLLHCRNVSTDVETARSLPGDRVPLPGAYRSFLAEMGRTAGTFFCGTDYLFPDVLTLREC